MLGALSVIAYVLGYLGYREVDQDTDTALYHSLQLYALESHDVDDPSWMLTAARFLAPVVAAAAVVGAVYALFREQIQLLGIRFRATDHVVVVGLGSIGFGVATAFHEANCVVCRKSSTSFMTHRVVVIESDPTNASIEGCRERGIAVVRGNASDPRVLARTRLEKARHLIVTPGDDGAALDVMVAAAGVVSQRRPELKALVHLGDLTLWRRLQAEILGSPERFPFAIEFFNAVEAGARALLKTHPPFVGAPDTIRPPHILLVGLEGVGEFVVLHAAGYWQAARAESNARLRVSVVGPTVQEQVDELLRSYPELARICDLTVEEVAIGDARFQRGRLTSLEGGDPVDTAYVCLLDESAAVGAALALRTQPQLRRVPIVVAVWLQEGGVPALIREGSGALAEITEFPVLTSTLGPALLELATSEMLAELRHEHYVARETGRGDTPEKNPSIAPWSELPDSLKESNRAFARHVGMKLAVKRCGLVPAPLTRPDGASPLFSDAETEELAREEHERWMSDLLRDDWTLTAGEKDPTLKLHPRLVPWEELSAVDQERDRDSIRELPAMLARAGFAIERWSDG